MVNVQNSVGSIYHRMLLTFGKVSALFLAIVVTALSLTIQTLLKIQLYTRIQNYKFSMFLLFSNLNDKFWRPTCGLYLNIYHHNLNYIVITGTTHFQ